MNNIYLLSFLSSFIFTIILFILFIPLFRYLKCGQSIRLEGPKEHYKKSGSPTMGGVLITLGFSIPFLIVTNLICHIPFNTCFLFILPSYLYMIIGFIDDYLIVIRKNNQGLKPRTKIIMQIIGVIIYYIFFVNQSFSHIVQIFSFKIDLKWGYGLFILLMFVASSNAVNLSDGLDGLATGLSIISFICIFIISYIKQNQLVLLFSIFMIASLMAFLIFNANPAKIFMGDAGSLMLGANAMILLEEELLLIIVGFAFVIETLSVIFQVIYFKITKGKRLFLMSPLHHHFELKGYNEWQIDLLFWLIGFIACIIAISIILGGLL